MEKQYEIKYGAYVDLAIPESKRKIIYRKWDEWINFQDPIKINQDNVMTPFEQALIASSIEPVPNQFMPRALQHKNANLEEIIQKRREIFPSGTKIRSYLYSCNIENFEEITGFDPIQYSSELEIPEINKQGLVPLPKIIAIYKGKEGEQQKISIETLNQLKLITKRTNRFMIEDLPVIEIFDFPNYRIELFE